MVTYGLFGHGNGGVISSVAGRWRSLKELLVTTIQRTPLVTPLVTSHVQVSSYGKVNNVVTHGEHIMPLSANTSIGPAFGMPHSGSSGLYFSCFFCGVGGILIFGFFHLPPPPTPLRTL